MEYAYGYRTSDRDFAHLGLPPERILIDRNNKRERLTALIRDHLRAGDPADVVHVIKASHIPNGVQRAAIGRLGAEVRLSPPEKPVKSRGRPRRFRPSPDQRKAIGPLWLGPYSLAYVLAEAERIMEHEVTRSMLITAFGNRTK